jgi:hypothetical protein
MEIVPTLPPHLKGILRPHAFTIGLHLVLLAHWRRRLERSGHGRHCGFEPSSRL